jgi:hypothetical protein
MTTPFLTEGGFIDSTNVQALLTYQQTRESGFTTTATQVTTTLVTTVAGDAPTHFTPPAVRGESAVRVTHDCTASPQNTTLILDSLPATTATVVDAVVVKLVARVGQCARGALLVQYGPRDTDYTYLYFTDDTVRLTVIGGAYVLDQSAKSNIVLASRPGVGVNVPDASSMGTIGVYTTQPTNVTVFMSQIDFSNTQPVYDLQPVPGSGSNVADLGMPLPVLTAGTYEISMDVVFNKGTGRAGISNPEGSSLVGATLGLKSDSGAWINCLKLDPVGDSISTVNPLQLQVYYRTDFLDPPGLGFENAVQTLTGAAFSGCIRISWRVS